MAITRPKGLGGGGQLFCPRISPDDPNLMFISCDMTGLYRTIDAGKSWTLLDGREVQGSARFSVAFNPKVKGHVVAFHPAHGLMESTNSGVPGTWHPYPVALPDQLVVTAAGFARDNSNQLLIGTRTGIYHLDNSSGNQRWTLVHTAPVQTTTDGSTVSAADVVGFVFLEGRGEYFCATVCDVLMSTDPMPAKRGAIWRSIGDEHGNGLPSQPLGVFYLEGEGNDGNNSIPSRIRGFAGASKLDASGNPSYSALYATVRTTIEGLQTSTPTLRGGVFRSDLPQGTLAPEGVKWNSRMGSGTTSLVGIKSWGAPRYDHLGHADNDPDTVYVTAAQMQFPDDQRWIFKGTFTPPGAGTAQENWIGVYDGFQNHSPPRQHPNVIEPGWIEEHESEQNPPRLGWGSGGSANGLAVDPKSSRRVVMGNAMFAHLTEDGGGTWRERYTQKASGTLGVVSDADRWSTVGLDVTTTWQYALHPDNPQVRFISSTDIGLARSQDGGQTWHPIAFSDVVLNTDPAPPQAAKWGNWYELAFADPPAGGGSRTIFAAVSNQHDIPHDTQMDRNPGVGAVLKSTDGGATWSTAAGARSTDEGKTWVRDTRSGLGDGPVVSVLYWSGVLYAAVWGKGAYWSADQGANWHKLGSFAAYPNSDPHCHRLRIDDKGNLYCLVAAQFVSGTSGSVRQGGLYRLTAVQMTPPAGMSPGGYDVSAQWEDRTGTLKQSLRASSGALSPTHLEFDQANSDIILLSSENVKQDKGGGGLFCTRDAGSSWQTKGGDPNLLPLTLPQIFKYHDSLQAMKPKIIGDRLYVATLYNGIHTAHYEGGTNPNWWPEWTDYKAVPFAGAQVIDGSIDQQTGIAPLRVTTYGAGAWEVLRQSYFVLDRSRFSENEVTAAMGSTMGSSLSATFEQALYVVLDGFVPAEITNNASPQQTKADLIAAAPVVTATDPVNNTAPGFSVSCTDVLSEPSFPQAGGAVDPGLPRRLTFVYKVTFANTGGFPAPSPQGRTSNDFDLTAKRGSYACQARLSLSTNAAPYMIDVDPDPRVNNPPWLSTDLRVFKVAEEQKRFTPSKMPSIRSLGENPQPADVEKAATDYIKGVLAQMTDATFEGEIKGGSDQDVLPWSTTEGGGKRTFNFAVARVRLRGTDQAQDARVFFRLFKTAATGLNYDENTTYRRSATKEPLLGLRFNNEQKFEIVTIPCFADPRVNTAIQKMDDQTDPTNDRNLTGGGAADNHDNHAYYGCWLDFNQPTNRFPNNPPSASPDGPYNDKNVTLEGINTLVNNQHLCLVAEIYYPPDPNVFGDTPGTSDNLAQRNLAIDPSANPGSAPTRTVQHSCEIAASEQIFGNWLTSPNGEGGPGALASSEEIGDDRPWRDFDNPYDELIFRWGNLPAGSTATLYLAGTQADEVLKLAQERGDAGYLERVDSNTLRLEVGEISYVPLPQNRFSTIPALLTIELPEGVTAGDLYTVVVHQTSMRAVIGTFQFSIPVEHAEDLLLGEERKLALLKLAQGAAPADDPWAPILSRSLKLTTDRVTGFGGDPASVPPSPNGAPGDQFSSYDFRGFFGPVDNLPTRNKRKAGSAVPVKFSLGGNRGLDVFAPGYPKSRRIPCDSPGELEEGGHPTTVAGGGGLSYDAGSDRYTYVWKTDKGWAGDCRQLVVRLKDGSFHRANFQFK